MKNAHVQQALTAIFTMFKNSKAKVRPHVIVTGESGSGKTYAVQKIAADLGLHLIAINAAQLTKEGTAGNSLSKALSSLQHDSGRLTVVFVDEFDKLFISGNSNEQLAHEITNGVQNEFLRVLESRTTDVYGDYGKYVKVPVDKCLFVFAGAFNGEKNITLSRLADFGVKTEFIGRVNQLVAVDPLEIDDMLAILATNPLIDELIGMYPTMNYTRENVVEHIGTAIKTLHEENNIGARLITSLIYDFFIYGGHLNLDKYRRETVNHNAY